MGEGEMGEKNRRQKERGKEWETTKGASEVIDFHGRPLTGKETSCGWRCLIDRGWSGTEEKEKGQDDESSINNK